ncbi:hypothetical protein [Bosea sp. (in: a-proteobacteria)]|uniref:hypothetical protein n=1 Tax=Bosea sp. (in: a-proteobacteria) TaxID=1871050 RepID=UPI0027345026|nr:hypothetical protein [Bosea sp. (in: a-proteobacteria)]MDP3255380.1 hypothetical protein [Bosea sp. (in: a-proteobacteria)]
MIEDTMTKTAKATDHREGSDDYAWIVAQLSDGRRLIECRDGVQWIVQTSRRNGGETRWYGRHHFRSKAGLMRHLAELERREGLAVSATAAAALAS